MQAKAIDLESHIESKAPAFDKDSSDFLPPSFTLTFFEKSNKLLNVFFSLISER